VALLQSLREGVLAREKHTLVVLVEMVGVLHSSRQLLNISDCRMVVMNMRMVAMRMILRMVRMVRLSRRRKGHSRCCCCCLVVAVVGILFLLRGRNKGCVRVPATTAAGGVVVGVGVDVGVDVVVVEHC